MSAQDTLASVQAGRRRAGRPRALTLDQILQAALDLGLIGISMPVLAAKLGISTATLYNYVVNRDDLLQQASLRLARGLELFDQGEDWRALVRNHADNFRRFWGAQPALFQQYMQGLLGPDMLLDYTEAFLKAMAAHGFKPEVAYRMWAAVNTFVLGTLARDSYMKWLSEKGSGHAIAVRQSLHERDDDELPNLRRCADYADDRLAFDFEDTINRLIESFADER